MLSSQGECINVSVHAQEETFKQAFNLQMFR